MNIVILSGNVCSVYDNSHNVKITIADNYKERTDYIQVALFNNQAEFARKYIKVGDHISVRGRISTYKGNKGETMGVNATEINFEGYKNPSKNKADSFSEIATDDDLPWEE